LYKNLQFYFSCVWLGNLLHIVFHQEFKVTVVILSWLEILVLLTMIVGRTFRAEWGSPDYWPFKLAEIGG